jgi:phage host-nuclease inhibitor protein Gam
MNDPSVLVTIAALSQQLRHKVAERDRLNMEIMELEKNVRNLRTFAIKDELTTEGQRLTAVGLTEAIRAALRRHSKPMTPAEVKTALDYMGFDLKRFKNASAAVHNTLVRMAMSGEIRYDKARKTYRMLSAFFGE